MPFAFADGPVPVAAGTWCARDEQLGAATVVRVEQHPEFERCWLSAADGGMVAEIVVTDPAHAGQCSGGGHTLFPRPELVEGPVGRIDLAPLCARLTERGGGAGAAAGGGAVAAGVAGVVALAGLAGLVRRRAGAFAVRAILGLLAAVLLTSPALFDGGDAGYEKLLVAMGLSHAAGWGPGYAVWMRPAVRLLGATPEAIFTTNLAFAALWPAVLGEVAERLRGPRAGWATALVAALGPIHLAMAWSESMHVSAGTWGAIAVLGAVATGTPGRAEAALGAGVAATAAFAAGATRADVAVALPVVALAGALAASGARRAWGAAAAGAAGLALVPWLQTSSGALHSAAPVTPLRLFMALLPHFGDLTPSGGYLAALHTGLTPAVWAALALGAAVRARRGPALRASLILGVGWVLLGSLPFLLKVDPAPDALRLQAFAQGGVALVVGAAAAEAGAVGVALVVLGAALGPAPGGPAWVHREEWRFLGREVPTLPADAVVRLDAHRPHPDAFAAVMQTLGPATWTTDPEAAATLTYRGPQPAPDDAAPPPAARSATVRALDPDHDPHEQGWTFVFAAP